MTLLNFKSDLEAVKYLIENSGESSWSLEKSTGISRQTIDRWMKADHLKIRRATLSDFASKLNYQIQYNKDGTAVSPHKNKQQSGDKNMDTEILYDQIALQKEKIARLENDLSNTQVQYQPHPAAFDEMVSMVESAQNTWNWTFLNSPTPMSIANEKGVLTSVNIALVKQLGYGHPDEMKNKSVLDYIHPDDKQKAINALSKDNRDLICKILKANGNYCEIHIIAKTFKTEFGDSFSVAQMKCKNSCKDIQ